MNLLPIGTRVEGPHGEGTIEEYNNIPESSSTEYLFSKRGSVSLNNIPNDIVGGLINGLYNGRRYPYVIQFDDGYRDVYSPREIKVI